MALKSSRPQAIAAPLCIIELPSVRSRALAVAPASPSPSARATGARAPRSPAVARTVHMLIPDPLKPGVYRSFLAYLARSSLPIRIMEAAHLSSLQDRRNHLRDACRGRT